MKATDNLAYRFPVSIKGIVLYDNGDIPLLKNEREEYELPGGKLEVNEQPITCLIREIKEELNIKVRVERIIDSWQYIIDEETLVVIITYLCRPLEVKSNIKLSHEHKSLLIVNKNKIDKINMPTGYKKSIKTIENEERRDERHCMRGNI